MALYVKGKQQIETSNAAEGVELQRAGFTKQVEKKAAAKPANKAAEPKSDK